MKLLTYIEVASELRCSERTVTRMVDRGQLERIRMDGRSLITATSLDAFRAARSSFTVEQVAS